MGSYDFICPCCGQQLHITISKDGVAHVVLFDIPKPEPSPSVLERMGYFFGTRTKGGEDVGSGENRTGK